MRSFWRLVCIPTCLVLCGTLSAYAQFSSGIEGTAKDSTGAIVAGAKVTLEDTRLGVTKTASTDQSGYFRFDSIGPSTYNVSIQLSGFQSWQETGLVLQPREIRTLAPALQVGAVSTSVEVHAAEESVNLTTPTTGAVISQLTVQQTPLMGQNAYSLAALAPGMTGAAITSTSVDNYPMRLP